MVAVFNFIECKTIKLFMTGQRSWSQFHI